MLEDSPPPKTIKRLLDVIPDQAPLDSLCAARGKGRDDVPVHVVWGVSVLSVILRRPTIKRCQRELRHNESLRKLIGIDSKEAAPQKWNRSGFLDRLGHESHLLFLHGIFDSMTKRLGSVVPGLGRNTTGDATAPNAHREKAQRAQAKRDAGQLQAGDGRKEDTDAEGNVTKVVEWFGFKLHLLADVKHERLVAYKSSDTKAGNGESLPDIVADARANLREGRIEMLAYDQAAVSSEVDQLLCENKIEAVIEAFVVEGGTQTAAARPRRELEPRV